MGSIEIATFPRTIEKSLVQTCYVTEDVQLFRNLLHPPVDMFKFAGIFEGIYSRSKIRTFQINDVLDRYVRNAPGYGLSVRVERFFDLPLVYKINFSIEDEKRITELPKADDFVSTDLSDMLDYFSEFSKYSIVQYLNSLGSINEWIARINQQISPCMNKIN
jgi:hypothetical protein